MLDGDGPVLALRVSGGRTGGVEPAEIADRARRIADREGGLRLLLVVERIGMIEALSLRSHLPLTAGLASRVERVAVVGGQRWLRGALAAAPEAGRAQVRLFREEELETARAWISEPD